MKFISKIFLLMLVLITACCGSQVKKPVYKNGEVLTVIGTVSVVGNEPFTRMVLRPSDRKESFFLPKDFKKSKSNLIGTIVSVTGKIEVNELKSADHKYTIYEYHLTPDKIEEVKTPSSK